MIGSIPTIAESTKAQHKKHPRLSTALFICLTCLFMSVAPCLAVEADPPVNDLCEDAIGPLVVPSITSGSTLTATFDNVGTCGTSNTTPGIWYTVYGTGNTMTATTCGGIYDYDTKISVFCGNCDDLVCITGNDDNCDGQWLLSTVTWCSQPGARYLILVHGYGGGVGEFDLDIFDNATPCQGYIGCLVTIDDVITFFDESVANDTIDGCSANARGAQKQLRIFETMILNAADYINAGSTARACRLLDEASAACDGTGDDLLCGANAPVLNEMITELMENLGCN